MATRKIIRIDEEKCNGCGHCAIACAEGAIEIADGKARLIGEAYCDGLGACIGECPQGAISTEDRAAEAFDAYAVEERLAKRRAADQLQQASARPPLVCPSAAPQFWPKTDAKPDETTDGGLAEMATSSQTTAMAAGDLATSPPHRTAMTGESVCSQLSNWPVQIQLVPPTAPYLYGARLAIAADCTPFAFADFHRKFLAGKVLLVGCPKLDDAWFYRAKLAQVFSPNRIKDIEVVYMEVPCCSGLVRIVGEAMKDARVQIPLTLTKVGIHGDIKERTTVGGGTAVQEGVGARGGM